MKKCYILTEHDVVDTLTSSDGSVPLSANQGRRLNAEKRPKVRTKTITLSSAGWIHQSITVEVAGITDESILIVSPVPSSHIRYVAAQIYCSSQGVDTLTFTCETVPTEDIGVNILIL